MSVLIPDTRYYGPCKLTIMVYSLALVKPEVPTRFLAVVNSAWKSDWDLADPSVKVEP